MMEQAAKQERRRQFNAAERERKSRNKTAAEVAQEQRELLVRQQQQVRLLGQSPTQLRNTSAGDVGCACVCGKAAESHAQQWTVLMPFAYSCCCLLVQCCCVTLAETCHVWQHDLEVTWSPIDV